MALWSRTSLYSVKSNFGRLDPEYYRPESLEAYAKVASKNHQKLGSLALDGYRVVYENTKILATEKITSQSARFMQATNVSKDGLSIDLASMGYVHERDWDRYPKGRVNSGELLIEVKGQAEKVTVVSEDFPGRTLISGSLFKLTVDAKKIDPWYLFVFMLSKHGRILRDRLKTNTLIGFVSKPQLYSIPILLPPKSQQETIANKAAEASRLMKLSHDKRVTAHRIFEKAIKLDELKLIKKNSFIADLREVASNRRMDADYYQTPFLQMNDHLSCFNHIELGAIAKITKGIEVGSTAYKESGVPFLRVSNIKEMGIDVGPSDKFISQELFSRLSSFSPQVGEVLLTKDGSPGIAFAVNQKLEGVISSGVVRLTLKGSAIPAEYLALAINSRPCQMQVERECSGALILHWKPSSIQKLKIPLVDAESMIEIVRLISEAKEAKKTALTLIASARKQVESMVDS